jgi:Peptidase_C39 like family
MPARTVPLAKLSLIYTRADTQRDGHETALRRVLLWSGALLLAALIYFGVPAFFSWKHVLSSSGGRYFLHRVVIPVPAMTQSDPRWALELLGPTFDTIGQAGCAITSASMVLSAYGVDIDPQRLNQYLNTHAGYTENGWVYWEKAAEVAPYGQVEKAYEDLPSYALIDENLLAGNPVIIRLTLPNGTTHFVVLLGKDGWDYLIQDPARPPGYGVYPLNKLTGRIEALRFFRIVPPHDVSRIIANDVAPDVLALPATTSPPTTNAIPLTNVVPVADPAPRPTNQSH